MRGVSQPSVVQNPSFPPCLRQKPSLFLALALQLSTMHSLCAPCFPQKPRAVVAVVSQPSAEQGPLEWGEQSPFACTLRVQPSNEHTLGVAGFLQWHPALRSYVHLAHTPYSSRHGVAAVNRARPSCMAGIEHPTTGIG